MRWRRTTRATLRCPACGKPGSIPIVYGYPTSETMERARRGEVALGGCIIMGGEPRQTLCPRCSLEAAQVDLGEFFGDVPADEDPTEATPDEGPMRDRDT